MGQDERGWRETNPFMDSEFWRGIPGGRKEPLTITARAEHGVFSFKPAVVYQQTVINVFEINIEWMVNSTTNILIIRQKK